MTKEIKSVLNEKTKLYKQYVKNGFNESDKVNLHRKMEECQYIVVIDMIEKADIFNILLLLI